MALGQFLPLLIDVLDRQAVVDQFRLPDAFKVQTAGNHIDLRVRCNLDAIKLPRLERPDIFANSHRIGLSCRCDLLAHSVGVRVLRNRCLNLSREAGIIAVRHAVFFLRVLPDTDECKAAGNHLNLRVRCNLDAIKLPRLERPDIFANSHRIGLSCRCDLLAHSVGVRVLRNRCLNLSREAGIIAVRHAVFFLRVLPDTDEGKAAGNHLNLRVRCNLCIAKLPRNELPDVFAVFHIVRLGCRCDLLTYSVGVLVLRKRCPHLPVRHKCRVCACVVSGNGVLLAGQLADQFPLLGHIELGDALVRVAKVLCVLIPAVEVVAGLFAASEAIGRKIVLVVPFGDGELVDLLVVLVIDRVLHGELIVSVQLHVAGLGDLRDNIACRIAPVEELLRPFVVLEIRSLEGDRKLIRSKGPGVIDVLNVRGLDHTAPVVGDGVYRLALDVDRRLRPEPALLVIIVRFNGDRCRGDRVVRAVRAVVVLAIIRCKNARGERDVRSGSTRLPPHIDAVGNRTQRHFDRVVAGIFRVAGDIDKQLVKRVVRVRDLLRRLARDVDIRDRCAETPRVIYIGQRNFDVGRIDRSMHAVGHAIMFRNFIRLQDKLRGLSRSVPLHVHAAGGQILQQILNVRMRRLIIAHHRHVLVFHGIRRVGNFRCGASNIDNRDCPVDFPAAVIRQRNSNDTGADRSVRTFKSGKTVCNLLRIQLERGLLAAGRPNEFRTLLFNQAINRILHIMVGLIVALHRYSLYAYKLRRVGNYRCGASDLNCRDCRDSTGD